MTLRRQIFTLTLTSKGWDPSYLLRKALHGQDRVADFNFFTAGPVVSLPGPNRDRLIALASWAAGEQAKKDLGLPSEWDQRDWLSRTDCGTACCIAGKIALEDGGVPVNLDRNGTWRGDWAETEAGQATARVKFPGKDEAIRVEDYAREVLGLTEGQAVRLFAGSNDLPAVLAVIRDILAEDDDPSAASTRRLNSAFQRDAEAPPARARRRRLGVTGHGHGPECDICYEDVPDSEITEPAT